jgi:LPXTG-site transpeptidase (sortase) family protein
MKKFILLFIAIIFLGVFVGKIFAQKVPAPKVLVQQVEPTITPTPLIFAKPVNLQIPKLGITTTVEHVGLDEKKNMDVPKDDMNVGWYQYGPKPGESGNSVLAGHFDTKTGGAAVFYRLDELIVGDEIMITDEAGESYTFVVVGKNSYPVEAFPIEKVFGKSDKRYLNLITCEGVFDSAKRLYSDRLVIRTELKG